MEEQNLSVIKSVIPKEPEYKCKTWMGNKASRTYKEPAKSREICMGEKDMSGGKAQNKIVDVCDNAIWIEKFKDIGKRRDV